MSVETTFKKCFSLPGREGEDCFLHRAGGFVPHFVSHHRNLKGTQKKDSSLSVENKKDIEVSAYVLMAVMVCARR